MRRTAVLLGLVLVLLASGACLAVGADGEPPTSAEQPKSPWALEIALPIWLPGNYGTIRIRDRVSRADVSTSDLIDLMTSGHAMGAAGYFDLRYDRVFAFVDALGAYADESVSTVLPIERFPRRESHLAIDANVKMKQTIADFGIGYRLGEWAIPNRKRPFSLDVFVGARYYWFLTRLRASASVRTRRRDFARSVDVTHTFDWADPLVGVRWQLPLLDCISADFRGDIGGFEAGSDIAWNLVGGFRYWVDFTLLSSHPYLGLGYRALGFERSESSSNGMDLQFRGPYASAGFAW